MKDSIDRPQEFEIASVDEIREAFPACGRLHGGYRVAYFDGPGGTQVPRAVLEAMTDYLVHHNANTHWAFPSSAETDGALAAARAALADFLNAAGNEIVFGANMTTLTFHLARAIGRGLEPGDAIVVTELDHHANIDPWVALERERGVIVRRARMIPETGQLDWDDLDRCLNHRRTRLLAIGAASNALGTVNDIPRAVAMAHEAEALAFVDAVHFAPHQLVDVQNLGCDFLVCSAYKFYGPHVGVLYGKKRLLQTLDAPKLRPAPETAPERLETGTQNHEGIVGAAAAVDFLASLARQTAGETPPVDRGSRRHRLEALFGALHDRSARQFRHLWDALAAVPGVTCYGPPPAAPRTPTLGFVVRGVSSGEVSAKLASRGIFASHGDFYAQTVIERLGQAPHGLVRLGCACYTTDDEIDRAAETVADIARGRL
jgi:cysteine desulfurase family protein (TIGR01976 family)